MLNEEATTEPVTDVLYGAQGQMLANTFLRLRAEPRAWTLSVHQIPCMVIAGSTGRILGFIAGL